MISLSTHGGTPSPLRAAYIYSASICYALFVMMHGYSPAEYLHLNIILALLTGVYQPRRVGMMYECDPGELLSTKLLTFMNHGDNKYNALTHNAALTVLY